ncbi:hypothetical protein L3X38_003268 [Prunus dulcis]|uniref:Uncharacterized protein n=1 Tax=Prunus dulcis TaxID=3755 RepID=A0AAD4ZLQ6_PRUDU|nr:hypothetical protein L3X38_003268 [Prunus dulcis]
MAYQNQATSNSRSKPVLCGNSAFEGQEIARHDHIQHLKRRNQGNIEQTPVKMICVEKPLASTIDGKWYSVGKNGKFEANMVFVLSEEFRVVEGKPNVVEADMVSEEIFECRLTDIDKEKEAAKPNIELKLGRTTWRIVVEHMFFAKPTKPMANHLEPLVITANLGGIPVPKIMIHGGAAINLFPYRMMTKLSRTEKYLMPIQLTVPISEEKLPRHMVYWMLTSWLEQR